MPETKGKTFTIETDAVGMAEVTLLLKRLKQIDHEARLIQGKVHEYSPGVLKPLNREARRQNQKLIKKVDKLLPWLEDLKAERARIVDRIQEIRHEGVKEDGIKRSLPD